MVSTVVDYLATRGDVNMSKLTLMGISLGGYLALRGAAFEPRVKAVILDDGVWDFQHSTLASFGPQGQALDRSGNKTAFDAAVDRAWANGSSALTTVAPFLDRVQIPVWVGNAANDGFFPGDGVRVANALGSRATLHNFTGPTSYHCEVGAFDVANQAIFAWLEKVFPV